jgi:hypothetical protein
LNIAESQDGKKLFEAAIIEFKNVVIGYKVMYDKMKRMPRFQPAKWTRSGKGTNTSAKLM